MTDKDVKLFIAADDVFAALESVPEINDDLAQREASREHMERAQDRAGGWRPSVRDEWIEAVVFEELERAALLAYDKIIGLKLSDLAIDGCIAKAPCGGEIAGRSPVDRGKGGMKRSTVFDGNGIPLGFVIAPANRHDSPVLRPTMEQLGRLGLHLPKQITVHLDAGYDSNVTRDLLDELGCDHVISPSGTSLQADQRHPVERAHSWHNNGFLKLQRMTECRALIAETWFRLANAIIIVRRLIAEAWEDFRWEGRPKKKPKEWR